MFFISILFLDEKRRTTEKNRIRETVAEVLAGEKNTEGYLLGGNEFIPLFGSPIANAINYEKFNTSGGREIRAPLSQILI